MQSSYVVSRRAPRLVLSPGLVAVCLFCLLGLAVSTALIPHFPPDDFTWILAHIE